MSPRRSVSQNHPYPAFLEAAQDVLGARGHPLTRFAQGPAPIGGAPFDPRDQDQRHRRAGERRIGLQARCGEHHKPRPAGNIGAEKRGNAAAEEHRGGGVDAHQRGDSPGQRRTTGNPRRKSIAGAQHRNDVGDHQQCDPQRKDALVATLDRGKPSVGGKQRR